jgi:hypothetical protein
MQGSLIFYALTYSITAWCVTCVWIFSSLKLKAILQGKFPISDDSKNNARPCRQSNLVTISNWSLQIVQCNISFTMYINRNRQFISHVEIYMICWFLDIIAINYNKIPDLAGLHGNITVNLFCWHARLFSCLDQRWRISFGFKSSLH